MTSGDQDSFAVEHPDDTVASFEEEGNHFANQVRNWLHQTPAAVPLIVLVISTIVFGLVLGAKFFSPFALTLILQQVAIVGIVARDTPPAIDLASPPPVTAMILKTSIIPQTVPSRPKRGARATSVLITGRY